MLVKEELDKLQDSIGMQKFIWQWRNSSTILRTLKFRQLLVFIIRVKVVRLSLSSLFSLLQTIIKARRRMSELINSPWKARAMLTAALTNLSSCNLVSFSVCLQLVYDRLDSFSDMILQLVSFSNWDSVELRLSSVTLHCWVMTNQEQSWELRQPSAAAADD